MNKILPIILVIVLGSCSLFEEKYSCSEIEESPNRQLYSPTFTNEHIYERQLKITNNELITSNSHYDELRQNFKIIKETPNIIIAEVYELVKGKPRLWTLKFYKDLLLLEHSNPRNEVRYIYQCSKL